MPLVRLALRIEVDEQDALFRHRERGREIDGGRRFGDATLLIRDSDDVVGHVANHSMR